MSDLIPVEGAGIEATIDHMKAAPGYEFEQGPLPGTNRNFHLNNIQPNPVEQRVSFGRQDNSFILAHRGNLYSIVDLQGDTSQLPRLVSMWAGNEGKSAGLALVDSKS